MVHARTLDGQVLDFGHSGLLYRSAFLLYDTATKSFWNHATGRALTGKMRGKRLARLPSQFVKWEVWIKAHPDTKVLVKDLKNADQTKDSYDARNRLLKLQFGLGVVAGGQDRFYELSQLDRMPLVQEDVGRVPVVVLYHPGTKTATAFERTLESKVLAFRRAEDGKDGLPRLDDGAEEPSIFHGVTGACESGPLKGKTLKPVVSCFWEVYAWTAHHPAGTMFRASVPPAEVVPDIPR